MTELWQYTLPQSTGGVTEYDGVFTMIDHSIIFAHQHISIGCYGVRVYVFSLSGELQEEHEFGFSHTELASRWYISEYEGKQYLICGEAEIINLSEMKTVNYSIQEYSEWKKSREFHFCDDPFVFDRYKIEHHGYFGFKCTDMETGSELWRVRLQGYLYSDIRRFGDSIIICTSGLGGNVYRINLISGEIEYVVPTKGTSNIVFEGDVFYCYLCAKKGEIWKVALDSGEILDRQLLGSTSPDCPLCLLDDRYLMVLSFKVKYDYLLTPTVRCLDPKSN